MFSNQPRKIYRRNQLIEVICQLRFPEILKIEAHEPADFQDAIRQAYPQYGKKLEPLPQPDEGLYRAFYHALYPLGGFCQAAGCGVGGVH